MIRMNLQMRINNALLIVVIMMTVGSLESIYFIESVNLVHDYDHHNWHYSHQSPWIPIVNVIRQQQQQQQHHNQQQQPESEQQRPKRTASYRLPAGAKEINSDQEFIMTFKCQQDNDGFFADVDNGCKIFHRCHTVHNVGDRIQLQHYSFFCGQDLVFDQSTFSCQRKDDAIPCDASPMFFDLNNRLGSDGPFLTDADIEKAKAARPEYRRRRKRHRYWYSNYHF